MIPAGPTVYRCYDASGALLYAGCSANLRQRLSTHSGSGVWGSFWWSRVARVAVATFQSTREAYAAEAATIWNEHPLYNVQWNNNPFWRPERARPDHEVCTRLDKRDDCDWVFRLLPLIERQRNELGRLTVRKREAMARRGAPREVRS